MATAEKKIERAFTAKDNENHDLEFAMINKLNMEINSIDEDDMKGFIKLPAGPKHAQSWAKGVELERAFFNNSTSICIEIGKAATEATEGATEAVTTPLQNYVKKICSETYKSNQNLPEENISEWVTLVKGQINDISAIKVTPWTLTRQWQGSYLSVNRRKGTKPQNSGRRP